MTDKMITRVFLVIMGVLAICITIDGGRPLLNDLCTEVVYSIRAMGIPVLTFDAVWTVFALIFFVGATMRFWNWKDKDSKWKESQKRRARLFSRDPAGDVPVHVRRRRADPDPPLKL